MLITMKARAKKHIDWILVICSLMLLESPNGSSLLDSRTSKVQPIAIRVKPGMSYLGLKRSPKKLVDMMTLARIPTEELTESKVRSAYAKAIICNGMAAKSNRIPKNPFLVKNIDFDLSESIAS